jgi:hypothetical protein
MVTVRAAAQHDVRLGGGRVGVDVNVGDDRVLAAGRARPERDYERADTRPEREEHCEPGREPAQHRARWSHGDRGQHKARGGKGRARRGGYRRPPPAAALQARERDSAGDGPSGEDDRGRCATMRHSCRVAVAGAAASAKASATHSVSAIADSTANVGLPLTAAGTSIACARAMPARQIVAAARSAASPRVGAAAGDIAVLAG